MIVADIQNIKIIGKNKKNTISKITGKIILSNEYRIFKEEIYYSTFKKKIDPPYLVGIRIWCAHDIDAAEVAILDGIQGRAIDNDKNIEFKVIQRIPIKRGSLGRIQIYVSTFKGDVWKGLFQ